MCFEGSLGCLNDFEEIVGDSAELHELTTVAALTVTEGHDSSEVSLSVIHYSELRETVKLPVSIFL